MPPAQRHRQRHRQRTRKPANIKVASGMLAHKPFWAMVQRVTVLAGCIDLGFLFLFLWLDVPVLAWINLISMAMYASAYWLLEQRKHRPAVLLIWLEVLGHAVIGTRMIGWDSGFHYYLLMFIPAIAVSAGRRLGPYVMLVAQYLIYTSLHAVSLQTEVIAPLPTNALMLVHGINVAVVFAMGAYTARFYYASVRRAEYRLARQAATDPLTGLSNRRNLLSRAEQLQERAHRLGLPISLIIADIDHFKRINDQIGHDAGDKVLVHIGMLLSRTCRSQDIVARWGGEEFLILLPSTNAEAARVLAERIRKTVAAQPLLYKKTSMTPELSLGVAELRPEETIGRAIARADQALYQSKENGRNQVTMAA